MCIRDRYLSQLNRPDRWGLSGTIYDYEVERHGFAAGSEATEIVMIATRNYDSADSYAATFLTLVSEYYYKTQDSELVTANLDDINLVAQVIVSLQDKDGLVFVKPGSRTKYLMDNAENYRGLIAVSYTHLDVYKRQRYRRGFCRDRCHP